MKKLFLIIIFFPVFLYGQQKINISGFVRNKETGELLIGANIFIVNENTGTITDNNGFFSIQAKFPAAIQISYIGFEKQIVKCSDNKDVLLNINLSPSIQLSEISVNATEISNLNVLSLSIKELSEISSIGGKPDISKSLQLLPGITSQNEGSSLLLVRGGDPGQNLYLFDGVPLIYVNHLGGFSSVFNPDIINKIDVYKSDYPANYGGKLSSVIDITQKEGNAFERNSFFSIGTMDMSFLFEGPFVLKNSSFIITGRKTLIDPLMAFVSWISESNDYIISYGYHDINAKFSWKPNIRNSFNINFYQGDDYLNYWSNSKNIASSEKYHLSNVWGNWLAALHWKTVLFSNIFIDNKFSYTRYRVKDNMKYKLSGNEYLNKNRSFVQEYFLQSNWKKRIFLSWKVHFGIQISYNSYLPNEEYHSAGVNYTFNKIKTFKTALYAENQFYLFQHLKVNAGLRMNKYITNGYNKFFIDPRLNLIYSISDNQFISLGYIKIRQFDHLLFTSGSIMNNEVWIPADSLILPAMSQQFSFGWKGVFLNNTLGIELNAYYKNMDNVAAYKEGFYSLKGDAYWQSKVETSGQATSKGIELFIQKKEGNLTGFASYTLSKSTRKYPNINGGQEFLFDYDRLHSFSFNLNYCISKQLKFNLVWIYQTGLPYTPALGRQYTPSTDDDIFYYETLIYGERNSVRMKDYHRLDLALTYTTLNKKKRKTVWSFSVYNVYNRHNPYYYYYNNNASGEIYHPEEAASPQPIKLYQQSFFPIIPSISYKVYFGTKDKKRKKATKNSFKKWLFYQNK